MWLSGGIGRGGFHVNFVLLQEEARVECVVTAGKGSNHRKLAIFNELRRQAPEIEERYGGKLDWQELPGSQMFRICETLAGGWKAPEEAWPDLQDRMIDAMVRLENAMRGPIQGLNVEGADE
jgi:hypothetical protein